MRPLLGKKSHKGIKVKAKIKISARQKISAGSKINNRLARRFVEFNSFVETSGIFL
jgi:hypothetical protein